MKVLFKEYSPHIRTEKENLLKWMVDLKKRLEAEEHKDVRRKIIAKIRAIKKAYLKIKDSNPVLPYLKKDYININYLLQEK